MLPIQLIQVRKSLLYNTPTIRYKNYTVIAGVTVVTESGECKKTT